MKSKSTSPKKKNAASYPQNYILPALTGANQSTETPAAGHFGTAGERKMKKIMTVIREWSAESMEGKIRGGN